MENSGPSKIYIHYMHIPEYISISQGYQRARILIVYISKFMHPLKWNEQMWMPMKSPKILEKLID